MRLGRPETVRLLLTAALFLQPQAPSAHLRPHEVPGGWRWHPHSWGNAPRKEDRDSHRGVGRRAADVTGGALLPRVQAEGSAG